MVTIIDDDKPGFLSFAEKRNNIKHIATEEVCKIVVDRTNGSDGRITCEYETIILKEMPEHRRATEEHFEHIKGELVFEHNECQKEIVVKILQLAKKEGE